MIKSKWIAVVAALTFGSAAAPTAAALVSYTFQATNTDYNTQSGNFISGVGFTFNSDVIPGTTLTTTFTFDTAGGTNDFSDPTGSFPYIQMPGGSAYFAPTNLSALSTVSYGPTTLTLAPVTGQTESMLTGDRFSISMRTRTFLSSVVIEAGTGDTLMIQEEMSASAVLNSVAGLVPIAGLFVPGFDANAIGELSVSGSRAVYRYSASGQYRGALTSSYSLFSNVAQMLSGGPNSTPVPEPGAIGLLGGGLLLVAARRRRRTA